MRVFRRGSRLPRGSFSIQFLGHVVISIIHERVKDLINIPGLAEGCSSIFTLPPHHPPPACMMNTQASGYANSTLPSLKKKGL